MNKTKLSTGDMIKLLKIGQVAQFINPLNTPSHYLLPKFDNAYCVYRDKDGAIRWMKGQKGLLMMGKFIINEALWELN